jgi:hypothetical protein
VKSDEANAMASQPDQANAGQDMEPRATHSSTGASSSATQLPARANGKHDSKPDSRVEPATPPQESLPTKVQRIWITKTGIDLRSALTLFKGAIAPTIATAAYQSTAFAETYTTLGYLVGITTILSLPIQPRAKFLQTMLINILVVCLGAAVSLLAMFCIVSARINSEGRTAPGTGGPGTSGTAASGAATAHYNSSASAVAGIWLFIQIFGISAFRANRPQFTIPSILFAIFANVSMVYAPQFSTMAQAESFAKKLLETFLTGFAISTGVSLLVFPLTSRQIVFGEMKGYVMGLRGAMQANLDYLHGLEASDMFSPHRVNTAGDEVQGNKEAEVFQKKVRELAALHAKMNTDLAFAKREVAIGKLGPDDLQDLTKHLRQVMIPIIGLSSMPEVFQRIAERRGWNPDVDMAQARVEDAVGAEEKMRVESIQEWHYLMVRLREPLGRTTQIVDEGLQHVLITLQLAPKRSKKSGSDAVEADGDAPQPGEKGFAAYYGKRSAESVDNRKEMLRAWCAVHDIELPPNFFDDPYTADFQAPSWMNDSPTSPVRSHLRRQLFLCLHLGFLIFNVNRKVYDLVLYVDELQAGGKLNKNRLIVPGLKRLRKWARSLLSHDSDDAHEDQRIDAGAHAASSTVYLGEAYKQKKDPEHLPPSNTWEQWTDTIRMLGHFFRSPAASFGLRCACATMSIAVVAFLRDTQTFYTRERLFWSQIMISISMTPTAGQSVRGFLFRVFGTFVAMLLSWVAYYIVDGKTAGVLVFYFLFLHLGVYIVLKKPAYTPVGMISQVTMTLILGYELQVRKVGEAVAVSNGQAFYPIYILGPVRLATVAGGLFLAWIWTVFPYPITEHSQLRQSLGKSLYLLANYYSITHETVQSRLRGCEATNGTSSKDSPAYQLDKARHKIFSKSTILLDSLQAQSGFVKFDLPIGGKFPHAEYQSIIALMRSTLNFMALVNLASGTFAELEGVDKANVEEHGLIWLSNFRRLIRETNVTSEAITTLLSLLSASVTNGSALPPYVRVPEPYLLSQRLDELDNDILSVRHIAEPGYSSFAVVQIGTRLVIDDLRKILRVVKELVGELDFSWHVVGTGKEGKDGEEEMLIYRKEERDGRSKVD